MEMSGILLFLSPFFYVRSLGKLLDSKLSTRAYFQIRPISLLCMIPAHPSSSLHFLDLLYILSWILRQHLKLDISKRDPAFYLLNVLHLTMVTHEPLLHCCLNTNWKLCNGEQCETKYLSVVCGSLKGLIWLRLGPSLRASYFWCSPSEQPGGNPWLPKSSLPQILTSD